MFLTGHGMSIEFVSRAQIFELSPTMARYIYDWQASTYVLEDYLVEAGEEVWLDLDDEAPTVLSQAQADEMNKESEEYCRSMCDVMPSPPPKLDYFNRLIAELPFDDWDQFMDQVGNKLGELCLAMGWEQLFFITDSKTAFLVQESDYQPCKEAEKKLIEMGLARDYSGGIILKATSLQSFIASAFWIERCNGSAPYMYFAPKGSSIVGAICKYGNFHFDCHDEGEQAQFEAALAQTGFDLAADGICMEKFSETSAIEGRSIDLD